MPEPEPTPPGSSFGLRFVTALPCEAKPLIQRFQLRPATGRGPFRIYRDTHGLHWLIVSGVGRQAAAVATAYLAGLSGVHHATAWLNVGIAGHASLALGEARLAHKITDAATGNAFYPSPSTVREVATEPLISVSRPEKDPPPRMMVDMEGAAFYATASTFSAPELVHSLKIVSDHGADPNAAAPSKEAVSRLIEAHTASIGAVAEQLLDHSSKLTDRLAAPPYFDAIRSEHHFTATQQAQLRHLLQRWHVLLPDERVADYVWRHAATGREVIGCLRERLGRTGLTLPER